MVLEDGLLHLGAHLSYFSGVTMLVPILASAWEQNIKPWIMAPGGFSFAIGLVFIGILMIGWVVGSVSKLFTSVGWLMILPGVLALLFAVFGQTEVFHWAQSSITGFTTFEPVVNWYVEHSVPKAVHLGGIYLLVGVILVWIGHGISRVANVI